MAGLPFASPIYNYITKIQWTGMFGMYTNTTGTSTWDFVPANADLLNTAIDRSNSVLVVA